MRKEIIKMKCYIATFYQYDNYGTRLQNYAMCRVIEKLGETPITIVIDNKKEKCIRFIKDLFSYLPILNNRQRIWLNNRKKSRVFNNFNKELCFQIMSYDELHNIDFKDSIAIAGSDQIWSPMHLVDKKQETELYFLRFAPEKKRYSYAPSFGVETIPSEMKQMYSKYISDFEQISVRESAGQSIIYNLTNLDASLLPDPVFLLSREEWKMSINHSKSIIPNENYIVTYFLSNQSDVMWSRIKECAKKRNAKIINIAGNNFNNGDIIPSPDLFVSLIGGAQAVFTDSFHGSVFSIIMQTPFLVFKRKDVNQFSRIDMLLHKYELTDAFVDNEEQNEYDMLLKKVVMNTEKTMEAERKKGVDYLKNIIQVNKKSKSER